jgi:beta-lactamase superfamily II metal-dependent hydrolase
MLLYYAIFIPIATGWLWKVEFRKWKFTALLLLLAIWCGQWVHYRSITQLTVLPLNGGSAVYFDAPGGKDDLLVDCGSEDSVDFVMKPYLRAQGVNALASAALTAGDVQQVGGFAKLQTLMPVEKVFTSSVRFRSTAYRDIVQAVEATPDRRRVVKPGGQIHNWTVLYPATTNHFARADDNALVVRGEVRGTRILLLSTLGRSGQDALLECHANLRADVVITGLPSQTEPLNDALLDAIHPALVIIADSKSPSTRHANRALRERLEKHGVRVVYTSDVGAVKISLRQNRWKAETVDGASWSAP